MINPVFEREFALSRAHRERLVAQGIYQFDGDPHWDRAMQALADEAIKNAEAEIAARASQSRTQD